MKKHLPWYPTVLWILAAGVLVFVLYGLASRLYWQFRPQPAPITANFESHGINYWEMTEKERNTFGLEPPTEEDCGELLDEFTAGTQTQPLPLAYGNCRVYRYQKAVAKELAVLKTENGKRLLCSLQSLRSTRDTRAGGAILMQALSGGTADGIERIEIHAPKWTLWRLGAAVRCVKTVCAPGELNAFYQQISSLRSNPGVQERGIELWERSEEDSVFIRIYLRSGFYYDLEYKPGIPYLKPFLLDSNTEEFLNDLIQPSD